MTVAELIQLLQSLPQEAHIMHPENEEEKDYMSFQFDVKRAESEEETFVTQDTRGHEVWIIAHVS